MMGLPIIAGAALFRMAGVLTDGLPSGMWNALVAGTVTSALTGWFAVRVMLRWAQSRSYAGFAVYRVALAFALIVALVVR